MISDIFYGVGFLVILLNILCLFRHKRIIEVNDWLSKYKKIIGRNPNKDDFRTKEDLETLLLWSFTVVITLFWMILGLLSKNWAIFLIIFGLNILANYLSKLSSSYIIIISFLKLIKSIVMISLISFLVINHFHLKIDIINYLKSVFNH
jgi:hypothetical protein